MLLITPGFAADENDINCIPPLQLMVRQLVQQGVQVRIIALEYPFRSEPYYWHGAEVFPCNGRNRIWLRWHTRYRAFAQAKKWITAGLVQHIYSFWLGQAWQVGRVLSGQFHLPHHTTLMGQDVLMSVNRRYLQKLTAADTPGLVFLSAFHAAQFVQNTGLPSGRIIPWGIDPAEFEAIPPRATTIDIIGVGSFIPVKNWDLWIQVMAIIVTQKPDFKAVLIGDGPERTRLTSLVDQLGLAGNVQFTGNLPRTQVLEQMSAARVLLHTSRFESFGYVLAEAAAAGCRVVSTPVGIASGVGETGTTAVELATLVFQAMDTPGRLVKMPYLMSDTVREYLHLLS